MTCPRCRHENEAGAKFCEECATPLARACAKCGRPLSPTAKFCPECAHPTGLSAAPPAAQRFDSPGSYTPKHLAEKILTSKTALEGERKQVTVLFADLKGSMELLADRDPEEARKILDPVLELMMEAVHRYEGTVNQVMGDGIMALFGAPVAHEDNAVRACYAALRRQETVKRYAEGVRREHGVSIRIRVGLNSGEVVVRAIGSDLHMDYTAVGQTTHLAARMEQLADPSSILLTPETLALAEGFIQVTALGPMAVRGLPRPVEVYELTGVSAIRSRLQAAATRGLSRFVGRDNEMDQLRRALEQARQGRGQIAAVVGEPGVGKSRLVFELTHSHRVEGWLVLEAGSVSYGKATSYLPVIDLLKGYFRIGDRDTYQEIREKVTGKLLTLDRTLEPLLPAFLALLNVPDEDPQWRTLDPPQRRQRTLDAVKRLLLREAQAQPLLVIFEDLHWIDSETQVLLDTLVESLPTVRLLLLVSYRPEYQHAWGSKTFYTQLRLDTLPPGDRGGTPRYPAGSGGFAGVAENPSGHEDGGQSALPRGEHSDAGRDEGPARRAWRLSFSATHRSGPGTGHGAGNPSGPYRPTAGGGEAAAGDSRRYRQGRALSPPTGDRRRGRRNAGLHAKIVEAIERLHPDRLTEQIERLAHHAVRGELWENAFGYLREAGKKAVMRSSYREATALWEQAVVVAHHLPETRITPSELATPPSTCKPPYVGTPRRSAEPTGSTCRSGSGSTRGRSSSGPSALTSAWTIPRWGRPRIWPPEWNSSPGRG
jgi:class 3 adenylate cyclase